MADIRHHARTTMEFEGVVYGITADRDDEGRTHVQFTSDPPPQGLDRIRYKWTGRLEDGARPS